MPIQSAYQYFRIQCPEHDLILLMYLMCNYKFVLKYEISIFVNSVAYNVHKLFVFTFIWFLYYTVGSWYNEPRRDYYSLLYRGL